jgi:crotonobetainyl-CoA:carnitine CoA-transferase CaiB-like acyl-CoA transferase
MVKDYAELAEEEQVTANGYIVEQEHPHFGRQRVIGLHVQLSETPGAVGAGAPVLGEDTQRVLSEAGYSDEEIERLWSEGVVAGPPPPKPG